MLRKLKFCKDHAILFFLFIWAQISWHKTEINLAYVEELWNTTTLKHIGSLLNIKYLCVWEPLKLKLEKKIGYKIGRALSRFKFQFQFSKLNIVRAKTTSGECLHSLKYTFLSESNGILTNSPPKMVDFQHI